MVEGILRNVRAGETFIVWDDAAPAATITVDRWANPTCGPRRRQPSRRCTPTR